MQSLQILANNEVYGSHRMLVCCNCVFCNLIGLQNFSSEYKMQYTLRARVWLRQTNVVKGLVTSLQTHLSGRSSKLLLREPIKNISPQEHFLPNGNFSSVVRIPKSSDKGSPKNYCPISLLFILSKLLEKHVYGLLSKHLQLSEPIHSLVSNKENQLLLLYWKLLITGCNCWRVGGT